MASISSFPSDLPCTSSEHIIYSGRMRGTPEIDSRLQKYTESPSVPQQEQFSGAQHEQFSAIEYEYKPPSIEESSDTESLPLSVEDDGTIIHTPYRKSTALQINRHESILGFDPLSSFTVYPKDNLQHQEPSFVQERAHPTTLRHAHGTYALQNDKIVQAITDAAGGELYWDKIKNLDLSGKSLTALHNLDKYCPSLRSLNIDNNDISHLTGIPKSVRFLSTNDNCLSSMTSFEHLPNLQLLHAARNKLENLDALAELDHLQEINVSYNKLTSITGIRLIIGLRSLDASHNYIERAKWGNWLLQRLTNLDLSYNHLWCVDALTSLPHLRTLNLEGNGINSFNDGCCESHRNLQTLNLKCNSVMYIDLYWLPKLQELNLDGNLIMSASSLDGLQTAKSLLKLSLREQQSSLQGHENVLVSTILNTDLHVRKLFLSANPVPDGLLQMPRFKHHCLDVVELANCGLEELPTNFGQYFPGLRYLNLNFNAIDKLDDLQGLTSVEELHLANNHMGSLRGIANTMARFPRLRRLDIRNNPATLGWYKPGELNQNLAPLLKENHPWDLPLQVSDGKWARLINRTTRLHKIAMELMLATYCPELMHLDGASFSRNVQLNDKRPRQELIDNGILINSSKAQRHPRYVSKASGHAFT